MTGQSVLHSKPCFSRSKYLLQSYYAVYKQFKQSVHLFDFKRSTDCKLTNFHLTKTVDFVAGWRGWLVVADIDILWFFFINDKYYRQLPMRFIFHFKRLFKRLKRLWVSMWFCSDIASTKSLCASGLTWFFFGVILRERTVSESSGLIRISVSELPPPLHHLYIPFRYYPSR